MRPSRAMSAALVAQACIAAAVTLPWGTPLWALRAPLGADRTPARGAGEPVALAPLAAVREGGRVRRYFPPQPSAAGADFTARAVSLVTAARGAGPVELVCTGVRTSPSGAHVRLQQTAAGVPIHGAEAVVSFDRTARPVVVAADLAESAPAEVAAPLRGATAAVAAALAAAGVAAGDLVAPARAEPLLRARDGRWVLEHRIRFVATRPAGDWEVWIDDASGAVREIADRTLFATGQARVFLPDPVLATGDAALTDDDDADTAVPAHAYTPVVLRDLLAPVSGFHRLRGPWVDVRDWEAPWVAPDSSPTADFRRTRSHSGFEDAMAYFHLDAMQRWYQELGFTDANRRAQIVDTHGLGGQDNSKFVPTLHRIACGEGGVDDAEDAAVLVHEYGHATQYDIVPTWGTGGHTGAMGEGFGDYLANSYAWSFHRQRVEEWNGVFQWDGHNAFWGGRRALDTTMHYPEHATGPVHRAGTLWCSALTDALYRLGDRRVMDTLVLDHHYALTGSATMADAANAILASDIAIYSGAHLGVLVETFARWGLVDAAVWQPIAFEHTPLDIAAAGPAPHIAARVVSYVGTVHTVTAWVRSPGGPASAQPLQQQADGFWSVVLPALAGTHAEFDYWLVAEGTDGTIAQHPAAGGAAPFRARVGLWADTCDTDRGWTLGQPGDDAVTGRWVRAVPVGTAAQPGVDHTAAGSACFVTQNGVPGAPAADADVDGGRTTLVSPVWDLRGSRRATLSYWRWYSNDLTTQAADDTFVVSVSNDGGTTWTEIERAAGTAAEWRRVEIDLTALFGGLDRVRARFVASDTGVGSVVEAGVDDVLVQAEFTTDATAPGAREGPLLLVTNPSRGPATLRVRLARPGASRLGVYDARGTLVRRIQDGTLGPGTHVFVWDGQDATGRPVAGGMYFVRLESGGRTTAAKFVRLAD